MSIFSHKEEIANIFWNSFLLSRQILNLFFNLNVIVLDVIYDDFYQIELLVNEDESLILCYLGASIVVFISFKFRNDTLRYQYRLNDRLAFDQILKSFYQIVNANWVWVSLFEDLNQWVKAKGLQILGNVNLLVLD